MINDLLKKIKEAIYGEEVRNSIHDAIEQCYKDATGHPDSVAATVKEIGEVSANLSKETADRKAEANTERKRIDNLIANGTAQTQEIGKKIIQDSSISSSGIVLKGLTNNNYYYKLFEESRSIDSEFCTITNQQGKYTAKLLKPGLYYMNFKVHVEMSGGFSEEVIAPLKLFKSNTLDWSTFDVLDAETVEISKTENTSINKKIHFLFRVAEPSYIRIYIDIDTSHTKTITFRIDGCDIIALDWKGKQSANLSELHDLRIGADGVVHNTAGEAVRKQIGNLTEDLGNFSDNVCWLMKGWLDNHTEDLITQEIEVNYINGAFWNKNIHLTNDENGKHAELKVSQGQFYFIKGVINYYVRAAIVSETAKNQDVSEKPHNFMLAPYDTVTEYTLNEVIPIFSYGNYLKLSQYVGATKVYTPVLYLVKGVKVNETEIDLTEILQRLTNLEQDNKTLSSNVENVINEILEEKSKNSLQINILHEMRYRCPFVWKKEKINLATFTFDDARKDISDILQLFKTKGVPCNFAVPPENLSKVCNDGRTVKEVLTDAQNNLGCEILSHSLTYINQHSEDDVYQTTYIKNPIELSKNGFNVKGLIVAGGGSGDSSYQTQDFVKGVNLAFHYLQYGDLINHFDKVNAPEFHNNRKFLDKGYDDIKSYIDDFMNGKLNGYSRWCNFASHGIEDGNINISDLEQIVDYCISKGLVVTTWNDVFKLNYTV